MVDWSKASDEELLKAVGGKKSSNKPINIGAPIDVLTRGAVKGLGAIPDLLALPYNAYQAYQGKEGLPSVSQKLGELYDIPTFGRHRPESFAGRATETAGEFLTGGAGLGKLAKFLKPKTGSDIASLIGAGVGTETGREIAPESAVLPLLGGLSGAAVPNIAQSLARGIGPSSSNFGGFQQIVGRAHPEKGEYIQTPIRNLQETALREREPIESAYRTATESAATGTKEEFKRFVPDMLKKLNAENVHVEDAPGISSFLKTLQKETSKENVSINALEGRRKVLNELIERSQEHGTKSRALNSLKKAFDDTWENVVENALAKSNQPEHAKTLQEFKKARSLNRAWEEKYSTDNPKEFGKKFVNDMVDRARNSNEPLTPESIVNRMFGTSEMGFSEQSPYILKELSKHLNADDIESIKLEALGRILRPVREGDFTLSEARLGKKRWDSFLKENHSLADELFDATRRKEINSFFDKAIKSRNPSVIREELAKIPFVGKAISYTFSDLPKSAITFPEAATSAVSSKPKEVETNPYSNISDEELLKLIGQ